MAQAIRRIGPDWLETSPSIADEFRRED